MKTYFSIIKHSLLVFLLSFLAVNIANGQADNFVQLFDYAGDESYLDYKAALETAADSLVAAFPSEFQNQFKVYDFGFYLHQENYDGPGYPEEFERVVREIDSEYYLAFGRQTDGSGVNVKVWVDVKLPEEDCFGAISENYLYIAETSLITLLNNGSFDYSKQIEAIEQVKLIVASVAPCCESGRSIDDCTPYTGNVDFNVVVSRLKFEGYSEFQASNVDVDQTGDIVNEINFTFQFPQISGSPGPHPGHDVSFISELENFYNDPTIGGGHSVSYYSWLEPNQDFLDNWSPAQPQGNYFEDLIVFYTEERYRVFFKVHSELNFSDFISDNEESRSAAVAPLIWLAKRAAMGGLEVFFELGLELGIESWLSSCPLDVAWQNIDLNYGGMFITFAEGFYSGGVAADVLFEFVRQAYNYILSSGNRSSLSWTGFADALLAGFRAGATNVIFGKFLGTTKKRLDKTVPAVKTFVENLSGPSQNKLIGDIFKIEVNNLSEILGSLGRVNAWNRVRTAIGNTTNGGFTKFATDIPTLESVSKLIADGSAFRNKVGSNWQQVLDDIIKKAKDGPCSSCGGSGLVGRSEMGAYLDDVDHFIKNFEISTGSKGETFYNWMRGTTNPNSGQLDELHQTLSDFAKRGIKEADVVGIGKQFPNGTKKYDLRRIGDKYTEYKNKDFVTYPLTANGSDVDQMINGYIKNINKLDDLEWKAGLAKLKNKGWTDSNALSNMKNQWQSVFSNTTVKNNLFDAMWGNPTLKQNTFGSLSETQARAVLDNWISTTDDAFFKFIKTE